MIAKHPGECKPHEFQDRTYGRGVRVLNPTKDGLGHRCTVCAPPKVHSAKRGGVFPNEQLQVVRR